MLLVMRRVRPMLSMNRWRGWVSAALVALISAVAHAQSTPAPQPSLSKAPPVWLGLLVMFLLLAMVVSVSLMPSKRGHQD